MGFFIFQKYDTDVTFDKVMGQCHLSLTVAANVGEVLLRRKTLQPCNKSLKKSNPTDTVMTGPQESQDANQNC